MNAIDHAKRESEIEWDAYILEFVNRCPYIQKDDVETIDEQYVGLESAIWGIKSDCAKKYWQRNMYSAADLVDLAQFIGSKLEGCGVVANIAINEWYELRKQKP